MNDERYVVQKAESTDDDVHIVGYGNVEGHTAVALDMDNDGQADVVVIDVDDSGNLSDPDVVVDNQGHMTTVGGFAQEQDPSQMTSMENPDVASDMPDYMNDVMVDV